MILKSVRVQNFKCIEDSTDFSVAAVTCLVGKNEAGKSALLQALHKLNPIVKEEGKFTELDYPRRKWSLYKERRTKTPDNVLTTVWELTAEEKTLVEEELGPRALTSQTVTIKKGHDNKQTWHVDISEEAIVEDVLKSSDLYQEELTELKGVGAISDLVSKLEATASPSERQAQLLAKVKKTFPRGDPRQAVIELLAAQLPTFLYFGTYDTLPGEVAIDHLLKKKQENRLESDDRVFIALLDLAGTKPEEISTIPKFEPLIAELEAISNRLTQEIFEYWSQNRHLEVDFRFDAARPQDPPPLNSGYIFRTRIRNKRHGVTVSFDERSSGFVWFFSFLVWFSQVRKNYGENLFILLDDPALNLHARAQADLLRYINEKLKPHYQVIYTTHSPFMVDPDNILNVRTVEDLVTDDRVEGTKVGDRILSADADTLFPLQAALGYDISQTLFVGKHTLLVEGPSDLLYLKWFSRECQARGKAYLDGRWVIAPAGGIEKIGSFLALFAANKLNIAVLTDYHTGVKGKVKTLRESELLKHGHVLSADMYAEQPEATVEDLLGRDLYIDLVNRCFELDDSTKIPAQKPPGAPITVVEEVEQHFMTLPASYPGFDHYTPALYLVENMAQVKGSHDLDATIGRFEKLFSDLNSLLPK